MCDEIARREDDLVELLRTLVGFDTVTHDLGGPPRQEAALQALARAWSQNGGGDSKVAEPC